VPGPRRPVLRVPLLVGELKRVSGIAQGKTLPPVRNRRSPPYICALDYSARFAPELNALPAWLKSLALQTMREIAQSATSFPPRSTSRPGLPRDLLRVDVLGWMLTYSIDPATRQILVVEAARRCGLAG
jgi:hypothetical protein